MAYISYYIDGLRVVDLRDPEMPEEIAHFDTVPDANERGLVQGAFGVRVIDGGVYISDMESGGLRVPSRRRLERTLNRSAMALNRCWRTAYAGT